MIAVFIYGNYMSSKMRYAGKAEVEVAYEYIVVMVAGCNQSGLLGRPER